MNKLLASVRSVEEAKTARAAGADVLDLKDPQNGALGALDMSIVKRIVAAYRGQCVLSATVGDLPPTAQPIADKARELAETGIDYIKIGFFDARYFETCVGALQTAAQKYALIGVLFADRLNDFEGPCQLLRHAGFTGVMIDTADKHKGSLRQLVDQTVLQKFVATTHELSLLCGIAGSLQPEDIEALASLGADYLGFRTALCEHGQRDNPICEKTVAAIAERLNHAATLAA